MATPAARAAVAAEAAATVAASMESRPTRVERNAAIAASANASRIATCPWSMDANKEIASTVTPRQPSAHSTCPWGEAPQVQPKNPKKMLAKSTDSTCPWGADANDIDSKRLSEAARKRQQPSPKNYGCAGSGAPKMPPTMFQDDRVAQEARPARNDHADMTQMLEPASGPYHQAAFDDNALEPAEDEDQDQEEEREIIQHCLSEGLPEERIMEILDEFQNNKLLQRTREKMQPGAVPKLADDRTGSMSLAANRQAKAKKSLSCGPADEEIVNVLTDYAKENLTPLGSSSNSPTSAVSLADKRKKRSEASEASVGSFDSEKSRAAYLQSKRQMDAVKSKNRVGSGGIF